MISTARQGRVHFLMFPFSNSSLGGRGLKILCKDLLDGVRNIHFVGGERGGGGGDFVVGWGVCGILKEILKLHNASIKSVFRITSFNIL